MGGVALDEVGHLLDGVAVFVGEQPPRDRGLTEVLLGDRHHDRAIPGDQVIAWAEERVDLVIGSFTAQHRAGGIGGVVGHQGVDRSEAALQAVGDRPAASSG